MRSADFFNSTSGNALPVIQCWANDTTVNPRVIRKPKNSVSISMFSYLLMAISKGDNFLALHTDRTPQIIVTNSVQCTLILEDVTL